MNDDTKSLDNTIDIDSEFSCESAILLDVLPNLSSESIMGDAGLRTVRNGDFLQIIDEFYIYKDGVFLKNLNDKQEKLRINITARKKEEYLNSLDL